MVNVAAVVVAAALAAAEPGSPGWPVPGEKVRLTARTGPNREKGVVVQTEPGFLTVSLGSGKPPMRIPLASIERLDVARGRRTAAKEGAIWGGVLGAGLGVLAVATLAEALCENASDCGPSKEGILFGIGVFGGGGTALGALVGLAIKKDRWERVPISRVRVGLQPVRGGAGVGVSIGWDGR